MLEDAAPMAAAEQLGQAVMEFDPSATVETVIELDENGQPIIQPASEELIIEEVAIEIADEVVSEETSEEAEENTPESEDKTDEQK